jgi:hypothetical protein
MAAHCGNLTEHKTTPCGKNINVSGAHTYHSAADTQILILKFLLTYKTVYFTFFPRLFRREQLCIFSLRPAKRCSVPLLHNHWGSNSTGRQRSPRTSNNYHMDLFWQAVRCDPPHSLPEHIHWDAVIARPSRTGLTSTFTGTEKCALCVGQYNRFRTEY